MKLRYSPTSPYVRKVLAAAIETGLDKGIERVPVNFTDPKSDLPRQNPLGKVPTLVTDEGETLFDSPVICEYLDSKSAGAKLFPREGAPRWKALRLQALADGILDAAVGRRQEGMRPANMRSKDVDAKQATAVERSLDALEGDAGALEGALTIGQVAVGCALGYLDFRFAPDRWREKRPKLAAWYDKFSKRPSMAATAPKE